MSKNFIIAVDFDGTIVEHEFPRIGPAVPGAFKWLKKFQQAEARLILWTVRNNGRAAPYDKVLVEAIEFCKSNGIEFWGVNQNPIQYEWSQSPKCYAHIYIDDAALGCPLIYCEEPDRRPYVDWNVVGPKVMELIHEAQAV